MEQGMISFSDYMQYTYYRGRVALYALLKALDIASGDEVLTQAFTCVAVPEGIMAAGAKPVWVDIEAQGYNMDPNDLERKLTSKTRAIVVQHTYGIPADMGPILAIAEKHGIPLIEDCCHTLASTYDGKVVGSFGVGSFYSFEWGKPIVVGIGGAAVVNDLALRERVAAQYAEYYTPPAGNQLKLQLQYLAHRILYRPILYWPVRWLFHTLGSLGVAESNYNPIEEGKIAEDFLMRMIPPLQQRLKHKFTELDAITAHSRQTVARYASEITSQAISHPLVPSKGEAVYARYPLRVSNKPALLAAARRANVELAEWYTTPVHPLAGAELALVHYKAGMCPNAEKICNHVVTLPTHLSVRNEDVAHIIEFLNKIQGE